MRICLQNPPRRSLNALKYHVTNDAIQLFRLVKFGIFHLGILSLLLLSPRLLPNMLYVVICSLPIPFECCLTTRRSNLKTNSTKLEMVSKIIFNLFGLDICIGSNNKHKLKSFPCIQFIYLFFFLSTYLFYIPVFIIIVIHFLLIRFYFNLIIPRTLNFESDYSFRTVFFCLIPLSLFVRRFY